MNHSFSEAILSIFLLSIAGMAIAQNADPSSVLRGHFPAGSIQSPEQASAALDAVQKEQQRLDAEYKTRQRACYERFLVTSCVEDENVSYQKQTATINAIELEANRFQRQRKAQESEQKRQAEEAERLKNAPQAAIEREQNRTHFLQKKAAAQTKQAEQLNKSESGKTDPPKSAKTKVNDPAQRQLSAEEHRKKVREAADRRAQMAKKHAENEVERAQKQLEKQQPAN